MIHTQATTAIIIIKIIIHEYIVNANNTGMNEHDYT